MAEAKRPNLKISVDDLFTGGEQTSKEAPYGQIAQLDISELHDFPNHPFKVRNDEAMQDMARSVQDNGVLNPILVRPRNGGGYEVIAGHRRKMASQIAGLDSIPAIVRDYGDDEAIILMVDSNIQRENILPSEKAFSYKMKLDALSRQGKRTSAQLGQKLSRSIVGESSGDSGQQVQRYIRLTYLMPELLELVDEKRIAFNPAVELSFLKDTEQRFLLETIESESATPSLSQAQRLKQLSQQGKLGKDAIYAVLTEEKPNQKEQIKIERTKIEKFFPAKATANEINEIIYKALEDWHRKQTKNRGQER